MAGCGCAFVVSSSGLEMMIGDFNVVKPLTLSLPVVSVDIVSLRTDPMIGYLQIFKKNPQSGKD